MLVRISEKAHIDEIIEYIGDDYKATPYLYVNVIKYGLGTDRVKAWTDRNEDGSLEGVYLLYYDCIHFYTRDRAGYDVKRLLDFIGSTDHRVVMLQGEVGDRIEPFMDGYLCERNHVIDMDRVGLEDREYRSFTAGREDIPEIVELLMADPEYRAVYDKKVLSDQMFDRYDGSFSRYFAARLEGRIAATCSTYGEVSGFALVGGVIVHPDFRRRGLAADVENYACSVLESEGRSRVGFVNHENTASLALHEKIGARSIATLVKFVKKSE